MKLSSTHSPLPIMSLWAARFCAVLVPLAYVILYTPYGMDTTDFGFFYGYPWRILQGEMPYKDFYYINPAFPLYWHAFWLKITPAQYGILGGKLGYVAAMLAAAWVSTLYINKGFSLGRMGVPLPLLATAGFVWGVHTFPHVPWHTSDGVFFAATALYAGAAGFPLLAGVLAAVSLLCKQSFLFVPLGVMCSIYGLHGRVRDAVYAGLACAFICLTWWFFLHYHGAWDAFVALTSTPLGMAEALDAGIYIYLRQEWWLPALAFAPWVVWRIMRKHQPVPALLQPVYLYLALIAGRYIHSAISTQSWIGFGESWPTLWVVLGGLCVLYPKGFLQPWWRHNAYHHPRLRAAFVLGTMLLVSWSAGISGGYKIPAFYALPLVFSLILVHAYLGGKPVRALWLALVLGLVMFRTGYEYPYTFPVRPMPRASLTYHAGDVFPKATGVYVDKTMYDTLVELKDLRAKYGAQYRVLPGFPHAYYLTDDVPAFSSEWLLDWQIAHQFDKVYKELVDKDLTVFMLRDQMDTEQADGYARAGYAVPQRVRKNWQIVEETPHFVVMRPPVPLLGGE